MTPKEHFAIAVRVVGLIVVLFALGYFVDAGIMFINPYGRGEPAVHYFVTGVIALFAGLYLLRGAPHVIRFAFPERDTKSDKVPKV